MVALIDRHAELDALIGHTFRIPDYYEVGREKIREFARATANSHPAHLDDAWSRAHGYPGLLAPPTFVALLGSSAQSALTAMMPSLDLTSAVQTSQILDYHHPIVAGDRLSSNIGLESFRQAFGGDLMTVTNYVTNQHGHLVVASHTGLIARSTGNDLTRELTDIGTSVIRSGLDTAPARLEPCEVPAPDASASPNSRTDYPSHLRVGDILPARTYSLTFGDIVHYAGVSGDPNPIHWHAPLAARAGFDSGIVVHGMLSIGLGADFVSNAIGDPTALRHFSVRMTNPVLLTPGERSTVELIGSVTAVDGESATISLTATHGGRRVFGRATAIVATNSTTH
ncbi:FAS1-like dehydratase domain-containing protein [Nocardia jejuensis]|uniref:FAS1-like dehydratase domain-containing protein n=1 Tax=Nocardia jejuensis TaxID=328049 RepID=UPI000AD6EE45|nr:MaoC family dehydratase N-terminal domain-containing protein [Nocardia jejuensis]